MGESPRDTTAAKASRRAIVASPLTDPPNLLAGALIIAALVVDGRAVLTLLGLPTPSEEQLAGATIFRAMQLFCGLFLMLGVRHEWWRRTDAASVAPSVLRDPLLWTVVVLAVPFRLYRLGEGLWLDEVTTLTDYVRHPIGYIVTTYESNNQHVLFSALARLSVVLFGDSGAALRLPAAVFGIASLGAVYALGREVVGRREGFLAALALAFSYQHVWFSQNARGYSGLLCMATVSTLFLVRGQRNPGDRRAWAWFGITTAVGMYVHLTMIFVVAAQCGAWLAHVAGSPRSARRAAMQPFFSGFVLAAVLTVLAYALVLPQIPAASASDVSNVATWRSPAWLVRELMDGLRLGPVSWVAAVAGLVVVALGSMDYWRRDRTIPIVAIGSIVLGGAVMLALQHHLWPRFFIYAGGIAVLIAVRGVGAAVDLAGRVLRWPPRRAAAVATAVLLAGIAIQARSLQWVYGPKQDFEGAVSYIHAARGPEDRVVAVGVAAIPLSRLYAPSWPRIGSLAELDQIARSAPRTWLLYTLPVQIENSHPDILARIRADYVHERSFAGTLGGGTIELYRYERGERDPAGRPASQGR